MQLFSNNASSRLAVPLARGDRLLQLLPGDGALFPALRGADFFLLTLFQRSGTREANVEIVKVTAIAGDTLTIERGLERTQAHDYLPGDYAEMRLSAGAILPVHNGALTSALNEAPDVTLPSADIVDIGIAGANTIVVTGNTTIIGLGSASAGAMRRMQFAGAILLRHQADTLALIGGVDINTAPGDWAEWLSRGAGRWVMASFTRANGKALNQAGAKADVGLANVDNTADAIKPVSAPQQLALDQKADNDVVGRKADQGAVEQALYLKADKSALAAKVDQTAMAQALDAKADKSAVDLKADQASMEQALYFKADKTALATKADQATMTQALDSKADKAALDVKADQVGVDQALYLKADKSAVALKADQVATDLALATKADKSDVALKANQSGVDQALSLKADKTALEAKADLAAVNAALDNKADVATAATKEALATLVQTIASKISPATLVEALAGKADLTALDQKVDQASFDTAIGSKADTGALAAKADKADVEAALALKIDRSDLDAQVSQAQLQQAMDQKADKVALAVKADKAAVDAALDGKADATTLNAKVDQDQLLEALNQKADKGALALKADNAAVTTALDGKADIAALDTKVDQVALDTALNQKADKDALAGKADKAAVATALASKADISDLDAKVGQTALDTAMNQKADKDALALKADNAATVQALGLKADKSALDLKVGQADLQTALNQKADKDALNLKADQASMTQALGLKADLVTMTAALDSKASQATLYLKADKSAMEQALALAFPKAGGTFEGPVHASYLDALNIYATSIDGHTFTAKDQSGQFWLANYVQGSGLPTQEFQRWSGGYLDGVPEYYGYRIQGYQALAFQTLTSASGSGTLPSQQFKTVMSVGRNSVDITGQLTVSDFIFAGNPAANAVSYIAAPNKNAAARQDYEIARFAVAGTAGSGYGGMFSWLTRNSVDGNAFKEGYALTLQAWDQGSQLFSPPLAAFDGKGGFRCSGNLSAGQSNLWRDIHTLYKTTNMGGEVLYIGATGNNNPSVAVLASNGDGGWSASTAVLYVGQNGQSGRSINVSGTVNTSGADYAEYMIKATTCGLVSPGQIVGITQDGKITDKWTGAVTFLVKSTNPSFVGGDNWSANLGSMPSNPVPPVRRMPEKINILISPAVEEVPAMGDMPAIPASEAVYDTSEVLGDSDIEWAKKLAQYATENAVWEQYQIDLEAARQTVDRIAYAGQVPVNLLSAVAGQYIVPVQRGDGIDGIAVDEQAMTMAQYLRAVGKVIAIEADGRARIIVKAI